MATGWAELGQVIRQHRTAADLSQEALAEKSTLHWTYLSEVERGRRNPSINVLRRLAAGLDVPLSQLIAEAEKLEGHQ